MLSRYATVTGSIYYTVQLLKMIFKP